MLPKRAPVTEAAEPGERPANEEPVQTSLLAEHAVDYAGEAAAPGPSTVVDATGDGKRPMLRLSSSSRAPEPRVGAPAGPAPRATADSLKLYREALEILRAGHPDAARVGFRRFLDANPQHDYADNALYWIGECDYAAGNLGAAERAFRMVVERYPRGNKVPDAMLKLGFTLQALGDEAGGRAVLESLTRAFPRHEAARVAAARLAQAGSGAVSTGRASGQGADASGRRSDKVLGTMAR
jgi:tol-pal system protein YbgF